jgi:hypothetical protein
MRLESSTFASALILTCLLGHALAPEAHGIVGRHDIPDADFIALGELFPSVGVLSVNANLEGSGLLIHEEWVLTAAHLQTPTRFTVDGVDYAVTEFIRHPDWTGNLANGNDIALARLSTPVTGVTPSSWFTGTDAVGTIGVSVGFGLAGTGLTGEVTGTGGIKRAAESRISAVGSPSPTTPPRSIFEYTFLNPTNPAALPLEGMAVFRDSGGPVFIYQNGEYLAAGIHSYVVNTGGNRGTYGDRVGSTRVSLYDEWITATIPEPGTWAAYLGFGAAGLVMLARHRRNRSAPQHR